MKPMSEKGLVDAYYSIYEEKEVETVEVDIISEQDFDNLIEELIEECIEDEVDLDLLEEAVLSYMDEAKVTFGHDTTAKRASGTDVGARRRQAKRKIGDAISKAKSNVKAKAAGAAISGMLAAKSVSDKAKSAKKAVSDAPGKAARAAARGTEKVEKKVKSGIKGLIGRAAKKVASKASAVASRMSEEIEALKESGLFSDKEIEAFISEMGNPSFDIRGGDPRKAAKTQKINKAADAGVPNAAGKAKGPILPGGLKGV